MNDPDKLAETMTKNLIETIAQGGLVVCRRTEVAGTQVLVPDPESFALLAKMFGQQWIRTLYQGIEQWLTAAMAKAKKPT